MTRRKARELAIRLIYAQAASKDSPEDVLDGFFEEEHYASLSDEDELFETFPNEAQMLYIRTLVITCAVHRQQLDNIISACSQSWKLERITRTAVAVLRCALTEILFIGDPDVTPSVAINEAVEISKSYDMPETSGFINGVLGTFMRGEGPDESF